MPTNEPHDPHIETVYEAPRVETSLTPENLAREIQYAGVDNSEVDIDNAQQ